jgi:hypothetical protein
VTLLRRFLYTGLSIVLASTAHAAKPDEPRPIAGLQIGPETTVITGPLNELGYPDFVAALNEKLSSGVAPEENFWTAYSETLPRQQIGEGYFQRLITRPGFERACTIPCERYSIRPESADADTKQLNASTTRPWKREEFPRVAGWLDTNKAALARAAEAAARPKAYAPLITGAGIPTMFAVLLPHVQQTRDTARALCARAFLALGEGRGDEAWKDVLSLHRIARHNQQSPFIIGYLVGVAVSGFGRTATEACLVDSAASPEVLARRWNELSSILGQESRDLLWLEGERLATLDATLAIRSRQVKPDDLLTPITMLAPPGTTFDDGLPQIDFSKAHRAFQNMMLKLGDVNETLAVTNRYHDQVLAAFNEPDYRDRRKAIKAIDQEFLSSGSADDVGSVAAAFFLGGPDAVENLAQRSVVTHFSAAFSNCNTAEGRSIARNRLLHAAFAAELHFRTTGSDVADSDQLDQAIRQFSPAVRIVLPEMKDPYTGDSFRIAREKDRLIIFALGDNLKSDGGKTFGEGEGCDDLVVILKR